jgi:hypothetical protein
MHAQEGHIERAANHECDLATDAGYFLLTRCDFAMSVVAAIVRFHFTSISEPLSATCFQIVCGVRRTVSGRDACEMSFDCQLSVAEGG